MNHPTPKPFRVVSLALALCFAAAPSQGLAGGLILYEVGSPDVGLASAGYGARAQDASTILSNPAGMARLSRSHVLVGLQGLYGDVAFEADAGTSPTLGSENGGNPVGWFPGGGAFFTYTVSPDFTLGIAAAGTFGMALAYEPGWVGRYHAQEATLLGISVLPSVSWKASDQLAFGASLHAMYGVLGQKVALNTLGDPDGELALDDTAWGVGANVGVLWEPRSGTRLGLTYQSAVRLGFSAPPEFTGLSPALQALLEARGLDTASVDLGIEVPQGVMASAFHRFDDQFAILASVGWQQWSSFGLLEAGITDVTDPRSVVKDLDFDDTWHVALGLQVHATPAWRLDTGIAYDSTFQDTSNVSPMLPAGAAWRFGAGLRNESNERFAWGLAAEYMYGGTLGVDRQSTLPPPAGGRGDLSGAYPDAGIFFLSANVEWRTAAR